MGVMMILAAQLDDLDGVETAVDGDMGIVVHGNLDAARDFLADGWYRLADRGFTSDGTARGVVVADNDD